MRLIDADALIEQIEDECCKDCNSYNGVRCRACDTGDALDYLERAPTFDQWHYPSKGEYPTEGEQVLCCIKRPDGFVKDWYETGYFEKGKWHCVDDEDFLSELIVEQNYKLEVLAWQNIVPPQEEV